MSNSTQAQQTEVARYLETGATDVLYRAWDGPLLERAQVAKEELRGALVAEVHRRTGGASGHEPPTSLETRALTRRKVEPMVRGLFPRAEQDQVLALVERSVVFLTPATIDEFLQTESWDRTAWDLANLYLGTFGAPLLGPAAPSIVGMSQEATCFVSLDYFTEEHPFADFVVHEVAHIFHNCKRQTTGLPFTRRREWLLDIAFQKRETFAYVCEAFARICERATSAAERRALAAEARRTFRPADTTGVDATELAEILEEAATRRNGWKVILSHCAPPTRRRANATTPLEDRS